MGQSSASKLAVSPSQLGYTWGRGVAQMMKTTFDADDSWGSTLNNLHSMATGTTYYGQDCTFFNFPDMLQVGGGAQTLAQYRAQFLLWAVLGTPLILGADLTRLSPAELALVTAPEVLVRSLYIKFILSLHTSL